MLQPARDASLRCEASEEATVTVATPVLGQDAATDICLLSLRLKQRRFLCLEATEKLLKKQPQTTTAAFGDAPRPEPLQGVLEGLSPASASCLKAQHVLELAGGPAPPGRAVGVPPLDTTPLAVLLCSCVRFQAFQR